MLEAASWLDPLECLLRGKFMPAPPVKYVSSAGHIHLLIILCNGSAQYNELDDRGRAGRMTIVARRHVARAVRKATVEEIVLAP